MYKLYYGLCGVFSPQTETEIELYSSVNVPLSIGLACMYRTHSSLHSRLLRCLTETTAIFKTCI